MLQYGCTLGRMKAGKRDSIESFEHFSSLVAMKRQLVYRLVAANGVWTYIQGYAVGRGLIAYNNTFGGGEIPCGEPHLDRPEQSTTMKQVARCLRVNRVKWHASSWTRTADPCAGFLIDCTVCTSHTRAVVASHSRIVVYGGTGGPGQPSAYLGSIMDVRGNTGCQVRMTSVQLFIVISFWDSFMPEQRTGERASERLFAKSVGRFVIAGRTGQRDSTSGLKLVRAPILLLPSSLLLPSPPPSSLWSSLVFRQAITTNHLDYPTRDEPNSTISTDLLHAAAATACSTVDILVSLSE
ncbi:hypothetical protein KC323_g35 [Hortaea werneckii]|nr:hypothetical protein KC323_g35 [Hortaea werneckii]